MENKNPHFFCKKWGFLFQKDTIRKIMDKKSLSECDICTKFITPALTHSGWNLHSQIREEVTFTQGRVIVRGCLVSRGKWIDDGCYPYR